MPQSDSPRDLALVLWTASPKRAADFARAEQEKACWEITGDRADFWNEVLDAVMAFDQVVSCHGEATDGSAATRPAIVSLGTRSSPRRRAASSGRYRHSETSLSEPA